MRLYQFTGLDHVEGIRREGLTKGAIAFPTPRGIAMMFGYQWLTDDPDWSGQGWDTHILVKEDRTAARFTVVIPKPARGHLWQWNDFALTEMKVPPIELRYFNEAGGSPDGAHWYVYAGKIPPGWLRGLAFR